jgi:hypothetical protein
LVQRRSSAKIWLPEMDLRLGYFADFLSRNTLLASGDEQELMRLANALRQFAIGTNRRLLLGTVYVAGTRVHRELRAEIFETPTHALTTPDVGVWSWRRTAAHSTHRDQLVRRIVITQSTPS